MNSSYPPTTEDIESIEPFEIFVKNTEENGLDYPSKLQFNYPRTVDRISLNMTNPFNQN